jgi:hypothetical protein
MCGGDEVPSLYLRCNMQRKFEGITTGERGSTSGAFGRRHFASARNKGVSSFASEVGEIQMSWRDPAMGLKICRFVSIYLTALTLSLTFAHLLEMPRKLQWSGALYMAVQHSLYLFFAWVGAFAEVSAVVFLVVLSALVRKRKFTFYLTLFATVCLATGLAVWFAIVSPANSQMALWHSVPLPANWEDVRRQWEWGHAASALLDLAGFGALVASVVFDPAAPS